MPAPIQEEAWECCSTMKKSLLIVSLVAGLLIASGSLRASDAKQVTITGDGMCAKCMLHEGTACQTVIKTTENGKAVTYYVAANDVSKAFHQDVCKAAAKVTATGTVELKDGKQVLTASKLELTK